MGDLFTRGHYSLRQQYSLVACIHSSNFSVDYAHAFESLENVTLKFSLTFIASSPGPTQILSRSHGEKSGEGLGAKLCHDRKWWTRLLRNVDSVS